MKPIKTQPKPIPVRKPTDAEKRLKEALRQDAKTHIGRLARAY
jgi:hypothetical protein